MPEPYIHDLALSSTRAALETMFFTTVEAEASPAGSAQPGRVSVGVDFLGNPRGRFVLALSRDAAWQLAANFLGADSEQDLSPRQVNEVTCELASILCGSILSGLGAGTDFHLSPPELECPDPVALGLPGLLRWMCIPEGELGIWLDLQQESDCRKARETAP